MQRSFAIRSKDDNQVFKSLLIECSDHRQLYYMYLTAPSKIYYAMQNISKRVRVLTHADRESVVENIPIHKFLVADFHC